MICISDTIAVVLRNVCGADPQASKSDSVHNNFVSPDSSCVRPPSEGLSLTRIVTPAGRDASCYRHVSTLYIILGVTE